MTKKKKMGQFIFAIFFGRGGGKVERRKALEHMAATSVNVIKLFSPFSVLIWQNKLARLSMPNILQIRLIFQGKASNPLELLHTERYSLR